MASQNTDFSQHTAERFAQMMISRMEALKGASWEKGWMAAPGSSIGLPQNITGRNYSGGNSFFLQLLTAMEEYKSPVFLTFKQAHNLKSHVLKGSSAWPVIYWDLVIRDKDGKKITRDEYGKLSTEEKLTASVIPFVKTFPVYNIDQTNLREVNPEKYESLTAKFKAPQLPDSFGMYANPSLDGLVANQLWVCPIEANRPSSNAYYSPREDKVVLPMKEQFKKGSNADEIFKDGMEFYSTMLHEMTHSTGTPERLGRDGGRFGDPKYAKEELVAEMTAAMIGNSLGFDKRITDNSAKYLDSWIGVLREEPKFIFSVMADVNKASAMMLDVIDKQRLIVGEEPLLTKNKPSVEADCPFQDIAIFKTREGDFAIRATLDGKDLEAKPINKDSAKLFFRLTDHREKEVFLASMASKHFSQGLTRQDKLTTALSI